MATQSNLLSPDELTALTEGIKDGLIEVDTGYNTQARVSKHDLTSEDSSLGVNVSSIDMINERFIRMFRFGLLEVLRTSPRVNPTRVQIVKYGDYLKELKPPLAVNLVRMNPLRGFSVVIIDPNVVFSSLDSFFWWLRQRGGRAATWPLVHADRKPHHQTHFGCIFPLSARRMGAVDAFAMRTCELRDQPAICPNCR